MDDWWNEAACRGTSIELWFPELGDTSVYDHARKVCETCPVRIECAIACFQEEPRSQISRRFGMRAGFTPDERDVIAGKHQARTAHIHNRINWAWVKATGILDAARST